MALTVTAARKSVFGDRRIVVADITWDSSYATGGESLTPAMLGLHALDLVLAEPTVGGSSDVLAYVSAYNRGTETLQLFNSAGDGDPLDEAGNDDVSTYTTRLIAIGH